MGNLEAKFISMIKEEKEKGIYNIIDKSELRKVFDNFFGSLLGDDINYVVEHMPSFTNIINDELMNTIRVNNEIDRCKNNMDEPTQSYTELNSSISRMKLVEKSIGHNQGVLNEIFKDISLTNEKDISILISTEITEYEALSMLVNRFKLKDIKTMSEFEAMKVKDEQCNDFILSRLNELRIDTPNKNINIFLHHIQNIDLNLFKHFGNITIYHYSQTRAQL